MTKVDLKRELKGLYTAPRGEPEMVDVPSMKYLMVDGVGDPNASREFKEAVEALYSLAYTLKFMSKGSGDGTDFVVMPLQGLWWSDDMGAFAMDARGRWRWTLMILQPDLVDQAMFEEAVEEVRRKKDPPALGRLRLETYEEGPCAQVMHVGPYSEEAPTIEALHAFIKESGHSLRGKHHEIYLSDPKRSRPERMRTIIRQPVGGSD